MARRKKESNVLLYLTRDDAKVIVDALRRFRKKKRINNLQLRVDLFHFLVVNEWNDLDAIRNFFNLVELFIELLPEEDVKIYFKKYLYENTGGN